MDVPAVTATKNKNSTLDDEIVIINGVPSWYDKEVWDNSSLWVL